MGVRAACCIPPHTYGSSPHLCCTHPPISCPRLCSSGECNEREMLKVGSCEVRRAWGSQASWIIPAGLAGSSVMLPSDTACFPLALNSTGAQFTLFLRGDQVDQKGKCPLPSQLMCPAASPFPHTPMLPDTPHPFSIPPVGHPVHRGTQKAKQQAECSTTGDSGPLSSALCQPQLCQTLRLARAALPANFSPRLSTQAARGLREAGQHRGEGWEMPSNSPHATAKYKPVVGGGQELGPPQQRPQHSSPGTCCQGLLLPREIASDLGCKSQIPERIPCATHPYRVSGLNATRLQTTEKDNHLFR